jgi:hypothetical protein
MGNRNRQRPKVAVAPQTVPQRAAPQQTAPSQTASQQAATPKPVPWAILISLLAVVVSIISLCVSVHQADINQRQFEISQRTQDRTSGKIRAQFAFVEEKSDPSSLRPFMRKEVGKENDVFRLDSIDDLLRWQPHVSIRNTGDEIIDSLRIDVRYMFGRKYGFGVEQKMPIPIVANETSSSEIATFGKLMPKQKATINLVPLLLDQMRQSSSEVYPDKDQEGQFMIQVYCRVVGASAHDAMEPRKHMTLGFHWSQAVFADHDKCETILNQQPYVIVE